jgi:hypothetical protein
VKLIAITAWTTGQVTKLPVRLISLTAAEVIFSTPPNGGVVKQTLLIATMPPLIWFLSSGFGADSHRNLGSGSVYLTITTGIDRGPENENQSTFGNRSCQTREFSCKPILHLFISTALPHKHYFLKTMLLKSNFYNNNNGIGIIYIPCKRRSE